MAKNKIPDVYGYAGNIEFGWRIVRKGGRIKFNGFYFQTDALIPLIGQHVKVGPATDAFYCHRISVRHPELPQVCFAINEYNAESDRRIRESGQAERDDHEHGIIE